MFNKLSVGILGVMAFAALGNASTLYNVTAANGATATANFTFGNDTLTLVLTDTTVNPSDVAFNLSAFSFDLTGATGGSETSASSPTSRTVASNGTFTDVAGPTTVAGIGWSFSVASNTYKVDVLSGAGHAGPANTILGLPAADNKYDAANGSIAGNGPHNPFLENSITLGFTFASGVTASTLPSNVVFQFGTTDGSNTSTGVCATGCNNSTVPEPITSSLVGAGLVSLFFLRRRVRG